VARGLLVVGHWHMTARVRVDCFTLPVVVRAFWAALRNWKPNLFFWAERQECGQTGWVRFVGGVTFRRFISVASRPLDPTAQCEVLVCKRALARSNLTVLALGLGSKNVDSFAIG